ncbi:MAG TPA: DUF1697 domain-containing protein [Vicinamibacterales bacterium]|nr:DUF1697 domain-containing protein [Vicinamibacterales bacterium]
MALVVFLRGVNVGGHKTFRPKQLAEQLKHLGCVNIGAAGTFVIRKRVTQARLRKEISARLPFECKIAICEGRDIINLIGKAPFGDKPCESDVTRFVSVLLSRPARLPVAPLRWPDTGQWLVRVRAVEGRFIVGEYRRNMKTISYLGALDKRFGQAATTRNWNTFDAIAKQLSI